MNRQNLHAYQTKAVEFICDKQRCMLCLFMGAGKTVITMTGIADLMNACVIKRCLIVAPLRVANSVWKQEAEKWEHLSHLKISIATGSAQERSKALNGKADIYVINRENMAWLVKNCKGKWPYDAVVVDESSSFKNHAAKRFKALKAVVKADKIKVMVLLTGTPAPNGLLDLWSQIFLIDKGEALGRGITAYRQRFFDEDYWGHNWTPKPFADAAIQKLISPYCISMKGSDYLELPERIEIEERVVLPVDVLREYRRFEKDLLMEVEGEEIEAMSAAVLANKLLQFSNGAIYDENKKWHHIHDRKLETLKEIVEENPTENILVAYNYKHDLARLHLWFPDAVVMDKAGQAVKDWNAGKIKMLLCHPASAGHGLNLQRGGSMIVWFGLNWGLEYDQQLNARLHRQGQARPVRIIRLIAAGTIDERVLRVLKNKDAVQADLLTALKR